MRDLYKRVVEDQAIKDLISKAKGLNIEGPMRRPVFILEYRGRTKSGNAIIHPRQIYANKKEYEKLFTEEVRATYNGRTVVHERGSNRFDCLTSIADKVPAEKNGKWVAIGYCTTNGKRDIAVHEFQKKEKLDKQLPELLKKMEEWVVVHQYGTKDYTLLESHATVKIELVTEGIEETLKDITAAAEALPKKHEILEFTEPEVLDLRDEELNQ
ncbi:MAG: hypothetical protein QW165_01405 [Candidatus Woesearchaeota archaeon]